MIIVIQKNLKSDEDKLAKKFCDGFIKSVIEHNGSYAKAYRTKGGWSSWLRRGDFGLSPKELKDAGLTFRRIFRSKTFGVQKIDSLNFIKYKCVKNICHCPSCSGMIKVKNKLGPGDFYKYYDSLVGYI